MRDELRCELGDFFGEVLDDELERAQHAFVFEGVERLNVDLEYAVEVRCCCLESCPMVEQCSECRNGIEPHHQELSVGDFVVDELHEPIDCLVVEFSAGEVAGEEF